MTTTEQIIAVATGLGWQASTTKYENRVVFDFQQYTPKGQDFNVSVERKISTKASTPTMKPTCG